MCHIYKIHTEKGNNSREQTECGNVEREKKEKKNDFHGMTFGMCS